MRKCLFTLRMTLVLFRGLSWCLDGNTASGSRGYRRVQGSSPAAAGPRGSPVLPQSERISLCCSSRRQSSLRLESYPGWEETDNNRGEVNTQVNKPFYHLTDRTFTHLPAQTPSILFHLWCQCVPPPGQSLASLTRATAFFNISVCRIIAAVSKSNLVFQTLVTKVMMVK